MLNRKLMYQLKSWSQNKHRKPLVLRGARQVGKTTVVSMFSESFEQYIYLNLELRDDAAIFLDNNSIEQVLEAIFFLKEKSREKQTLIFIDEIQNSPQAVALLRYFYEVRPDLYVIAAGSLLETLLDVSISFPVGRVEFMVMHPFTFEEYLWAVGETQAADILNTTPCPTYADEKMRDLFHRYIQVGGMPEAVKVYVETGDLQPLGTIYENLITAYIEDIEKYAKRDRLVPILRHVIQTAFHEVGTRIRYTGFGNSNYRAGEIKEALQLLQKAFLFQVVHPTTTTTLPIVQDLKKAPRIQTLDTGLVTYMTRTQRELFINKDLSGVFFGKIVEHIVGQELHATSNSPMNKLNFWVREKSQSSAEVDFLVEHKGLVIPVEVKSGATGRLRSLHSFIDKAPHSTAVRVYGGKFSVERATTIAKKPFTLINLPYYLTSRINQYLDRYAT
jgi:uncharacterized protein